MKIPSFGEPSKVHKSWPSLPAIWTRDTIFGQVFGHAFSLQLWVILVLPFGKSFAGHSNVSRFPLRKKGT